MLFGAFFFFLVYFSGLWGFFLLLFCLGGGEGKKTGFSDCLSNADIWHMVAGLFSHLSFRKSFRKIETSDMTLVDSGSHLSMMERFLSSKKSVACAIHNYSSEYNL